ncbi:hypothetical protein D1007_19247 [Hordeum vulgare]|nr:hypothetical protein D1007_19247 [Hordeum vulgare]
MAVPLIMPWLVIPLSYLGGGGDSPMEARRLLLATTAHVYDPTTKTLRMVASMEGDKKSGCDVPEFMADRLRLVLYQESLAHIAGMEYGEDATGYSLLLAKDVLPGSSLETDSGPPVELGCTDRAGPTRTIALCSAGNLRQ